ncbi:hypothetical protein A6X21_08150 [Planctopirus hydrillae]|uniref:Uncharacterized protein n=1 Tax=Planctopirus hydrillae TaxID=1841610 RepID=A0A1C3E8R5_9PLAN|nr:hypothetical protein A6X21_08150 [Planctopirus hydrillae]
MAATPSHGPKNCPALITGLTPALLNERLLAEPALNGRQKTKHQSRFRIRYDRGQQIIHAGTTRHSSLPAIAC